MNRNEVSRKTFREQGTGNSSRGAKRCARIGSMLEEKRIANERNSGNTQPTVKPPPSIPQDLRDG